MFLGMITNWQSFTVAIVSVQQVEMSQISSELHSLEVLESTTGLGATTLQL
jgi:hypothetical protein